MTAPARSWLFVPATRPERFSKAAASADRVIVDLEDAVAPEAKSAARSALIQANLPDNLPVYLRINGAGTEWFAKDLQVAARLKLAGVVLPKAETAQQLAHVAGELGDQQSLVPLVETALGLHGTLELARGPRVERLAFGAMDFRLDTGIQGEEIELAYARSCLVISSRVAGIAPPLDSVSVSIDDENTVAQDAERSRRFGFGGKLCIHPRQIGPIHRAFLPSPAEVEWAEGLMAALASRPERERGAFSYQGGMVDRPVVERARQILSIARPPEGSF